MERVTFLIERSGARIACLLNPESLEARRQAGITRRRYSGGGVLGNPRSDDPLISTGGGITEYDLQLLFDIDVANEGRPARAPAPPLQSMPPAAVEAAAPEVPADGSAASETPAPIDAAEPDTPVEDPPKPGETEAPVDPVALDEPAEPADSQPAESEPKPGSEPGLSQAGPLADAIPLPASAAPPAQAPEPPGVIDVRELTQPLWALAETGALVDGAIAPQRVRFIWGKSWNIPAVVLAVAERLERFDANGVPQRSWLSLRLRRVEEQAEGAAPPRQPTTPQFQIDQAGGTGVSREDQEVITMPVDPEGYAIVRHDQIGAEFYGDPALGRAVYEYNERDDLLRSGEGDRLRLPPRELLMAG